MQPDAASSNPCNQSSSPAQTSPARIGVLDSGVGGLSVLREIHRLLPDHPTTFLADQAHLPYGSRPKIEIFAFSDAITRFLRARDAAVVVLACNTASAASLIDLRARYPDFPFVGMEPAVKPAAETTQSGVIGVLATHTTATGDLYRRTVARHAAAVRVIMQVAPDLVRLVEDEAWDTDAGIDILRANLAPLLDAGADQIVLACTHFPFLADAIKRIIHTEYADQAALVDPSAAVARQVERLIEVKHRSSMEAASVSPTHEYFTTGNPAHFRGMMRRLIGVDAPVQRAVWKVHHADDDPVGELSIAAETDDDS